MTGGDSIPVRLSCWHAAGRPRLAAVRSWPERTVSGEVVMCPSQSADEGTLVLGIFGDDGRLSRQSVPNHALVAENEAGSHAIRYAGECRQDDCAYWADSCQLAAAIVRDDDSCEPIAQCPIRQRCRWHLEHGSKACGTCSLVRYQMSVDDTLLA